MVVFPVHPRTRARMQEEGLTLGDHVRLIEPLSYLELASLASQARVIVTDSGGLQKEAYWYGVPCVTVRPSTEWVDTVAVGANVLVDADPEALADAVARRDDAARPAGALRRRPRLGADRAGARRYDPEPMKRDVAIIGAGYVGLPLARTFADAGKQRAARRRRRRSRRTQLNAGESYIEDVPTEVLKPLVDAGLVTATTDYDELREADAILVALPTPLSRQREPDLRILVSAAESDRNASPRGTSRRSSSRRRIPGTTREQVQPILEAGSGLTAGKDFHLAFSPERVDPGSRGLDDEDRDQGRRRDRRRLDRCSRRALLGRDRQRPPRLVARGSRAHEAPREHLPLGQHRARQRARAALRPDGHRRLGGHRGRRDEAVRLHVVPAGARASAATASRSIPSTSRGRRASSASTPSSSSSRGRSTSRCRTSVARSSRRRSTTPVSARSRARRSSSSASPTSRTSRTRASRRRSS